MRHEHTSRRLAGLALLGLTLALLPAGAVLAEDTLGEVDCQVGRPPPLRVGSPESTFDSPHHGWTSSDGADALHAANGQLIVDDISEDWLWLTASSNFHGKWDRVARIELRVRASASSSLRHPAIIELKGGESRATFELHKRFLRAGEWTDVSIPLDRALWKVEGSWARVLEHVDRVRVRLDLDSRTDAMERHLIEHFRLVAVPLSEFAENSQGWICTDGIMDEAEGHVVVRDTGRGWCWLRAPRAFRGDLRGYRALEVRLRSEASREPDQPLRVQLENGEQLAIHQVAPERIGSHEWTTITVPLDRETWALTGEWDALLAGVTDLHIRVDVASSYGRDEIVRIASVRLIER